MDFSHISSHDSDFSYAHSKLISIAIEATEILHLSEQYLSLELQLVNSLLISIRNIPVATVIHIPCSIRSLCSQALCSVLKAATQSAGFIQMALFSKVDFCAPAHHLPSRHEASKSLLKSCLKTWQSQGGIVKLWKKVEGLSAPPSFYSNSPSISNLRALHRAWLGRLSNAIKAVPSSGVANPEISAVQVEILEAPP